MAKQVTIPRILKKAADGGRIVEVTAYDHPSARLADEAGIEIILVGDSMGNVMQGGESTLGVTLEESLYHARIVAKGAARAFVVGDMPFGSYAESPEQTVRNAVRYIKEAGTRAVKLEGGSEWAAKRIRACVEAQIPIQGHIGLMPQSVHVMGGYRVQRDEQSLLEAAKRVEAAGAFSIVLEGVPADIAKRITEALTIPTIGIGAGPHTNGQVLVWHDLLGINESPASFVKAYASLAGTIRDALRAYKDDVEGGQFPDAAHSYQ